MEALFAAFTGPVYHIFPLGALGAERRREESPFDLDNPVPSESDRNIRTLEAWIPHLLELGVEAVLFGPVFSSESHGYDVQDLFRIDPRLGTNEDFAALCRAFHRAGISVLLDAVFNHVGRTFSGFADVRELRENSSYAEWFSGLRFDGSGPAGDGVCYDTWDGHGSLVKLNVTRPEVRDYLLGAVDLWLTEFAIDGLRLDAADVIDPAFWTDLRARVDSRYDADFAFGRGHFWLNGEMVHGDYSTITGKGLLDGTTNYEVYKGLYSSCNDGNFHEIAHSLERQFGPGGVYRGLPLLTFLDNHDVPRIASTLLDLRHLTPLHILLFTVPGTPTIYYGSELGIAGTKGTDDWALRPTLTPEDLRRAIDASQDDDPQWAPEARSLPQLIARLAELRKSHPELSGGDFSLLSVTSHQIVFSRGSLVIAVNGATEEATVSLAGAASGSGLPSHEHDGREATGVWHDLLSGEAVTPHGDDLEVTIPAMGGRILTS